MSSDIEKEGRGANDAHLLVQIPHLIWCGKSACARGAIGTRRIGSHKSGHKCGSKDARRWLGCWRDGLSKGWCLVNRSRAPADLVKLLDSLHVNEWTARVPDLNAAVDT